MLGFLAQADTGQPAPWTDVQSRRTLAEAISAQRAQENPQGVAGGLASLGTGVLSAILHRSVNRDEAVYDERADELFRTAVSRGATRSAIADAVSAPMMGAERQGILKGMLEPEKASSAAKFKIIGSPESGYHRVAVDGEPGEVVAPFAGGGKSEIGRFKAGTKGVTDSLTGEFTPYPQGPAEQIAPNDRFKVIDNGDGTQMLYDFVAIGEARSRGEDPGVGVSLLGTPTDKAVAEANLAAARAALAGSQAKKAESEVGLGFAELDHDIAALAQKAGIDAQKLAELIRSNKAGEAIDQQNADTNATRADAAVTAADAAAANAATNAAEAQLQYASIADRAAQWRNEHDLREAGKWTKPANTSVNVNNAQGSLQKMLGSKAAESIDQIAADAAAGAEQVQNMAVIWDSTFQDTYSSGAFQTKFFKPLRSVLERLGGLEKGSLKWEELVEAISNDATMDRLGGSLGHQISNSDRDFIKAIMPGIDDTPEGARMKILVIERLLERQREYQNAYLDFADANPNMTGLDFQKFRIQWQTEAAGRPLFGKEWLEEAEWQAENGRISQRARDALEGGGDG